MYGQIVSCILQCPPAHHRLTWSRYIYCSHIWYLVSYHAWNESPSRWYCQNVIFFIRSKNEYYERNISISAQDGDEGSVRMPHLPRWQMTDASPGPGANRVYIDPGDRRTRDTTTGTYGHWTRAAGPRTGTGFHNIICTFTISGNFGVHWGWLKKVLTILCIMNTHALGRDKSKGLLMILRVWKQ